MQNSAAVYSGGFVSPKSRRLRTIAAIMLAALIGMAIYGMRVLTPSVISAAEQHVTVAAPGHTPISNSSVSPTTIHVSSRSARLIRVKVLFMYGYWTVWTLIALSLLLFVWLDIREVQKFYLERRKDLWDQALTSTATNKTVQMRSAALEEQPDANALPSPDQEGR